MTKAIIVTPHMSKSIIGTPTTTVDHSSLLSGQFNEQFLLILLVFHGISP
jgi:hypothetical protein